jgi:hypothetical protein
MTDKETIAFAPEVEILRHIEELIRLLVEGKATQNDMQLLHDLQKRRVELMRPRFVAAPEKIPA